MTEAVAYREIIHTPADSATEYVAWAESIQGARGVPFGVPIVDRYMIPMHPGNVIVICGRPSHGKTSLMAFLARNEGKRIAADGRIDECVVYVTFDQVVEEVEAVFQFSDQYSTTDLAWGRVDIDVVRRESFKRAGLPVFLIGDSLARTGVHSPRLYPEVVFSAIEGMERDYQIKPTLLLFDYVQIIPIKRSERRTEQVIEAIHRVKEIAKRLGCPAVVGVQARRDVDDRDIKIPSLRDAQWASEIEQVTDKFFSVWRPWVTEDHYTEHGEQATITIDSRIYPVTEELLVLKMGKQRFDRGVWTWGLRFDPAYLTLCDIERDVDEIVGWDDR